MSAWVCRDNSGTDLFTFEADSFEDAIQVAQGDDRVPLDGAQIFPVKTVPGWAFEHGYVAVEEMTALGVTEFFERVVVPAEVAA